jgi:hypothetical protein
MGLAKEVRDELLALTARDGAVIEQHADGSRTVVPVTPPERPMPAPVSQPAQTQWSD